MNKNCIFTIVAKNYIGLGKILMKSVRQYNKNVDTFIMVADSYDNDSNDDEIKVIKDFANIEDSKWREMALKYDITEFCTALKPYCFLAFFYSYEYVIYLDPDILVYASFEKVLKRLSTQSIALTPHVARLHVDYEGDLPENQLIGTGVFNLGFCAMRNNQCSKDIVKWWCNKLDNQCFSDVYNYLYTDQHWMDLIPAYYPNELYVISDLGYNVAPWNFFEREIVKYNNHIYVKERNSSKTQMYELVFVHYSGYNYKDLLVGEIKQNNFHKDLAYDDISIILDEYRVHLSMFRDEFLKYISMDYSYNRFPNGCDITYFHRRLFNAIKDNEEFSAYEYYAMLRKSKLIVKSKNVEKTNVHNMSNMNSYIAKFNFIFKFFFKIVGYEKYILMVKAMRYYSRYENHCFLIKK